MALKRTKTLASKIAHKFSLNKVQTNDKFAILIAAYSKPDDTKGTISKAPSQLEDHSTDN